MFPSASLILSAGRKGLEILLSVSIFANSVVELVQESRYYSRLSISSGPAARFTDKVLGLCRNCT